MTIPFNKFEEDVFLTTVLIENLDDQEFGTGFLVRKSVEPDRMKILLFSNKHVFWGREHKSKSRSVGRYRVTFHLKDSGVPGVDAQTQVTILTVNRSDGYFEHPDADVDVACANISPLFEKTALSAKLLPFEELTAFKFSDLHAGSPVVFIGYPSGFYDRAHSLPVLRSGHIASIPAVDFEGKPQVLIDAPVFPGSSGSPVFSVVGGKYRLLGIVSESAQRPLDFLEVQSAAQATAASGTTVRIPAQFIGLGILYKIQTVQTVFDLA